MEHDAGVYVVLLKSGAFYVGKSANIAKRLAQHTSKWVHMQGNHSERREFLRCTKKLL